MSRSRSYNSSSIGNSDGIRRESNSSIEALERSDMEGDCINAEKNKSFGTSEHVVVDDAIIEGNSKCDYNIIKIDKKDFSEHEKLYPSTSNYDPFGDKDMFSIDMSKLKDEFCYPADGYLISKFGMRNGRMHNGTDIKAYKGDNIYAAFDGVVRVSRLFSSYGNIVVIRHYNGLESVYSHNNKNIVKSGQEVKAGDVIAYAGRTGRASGDHLHFEIRVVGKPINPEILLDTKERALKSSMLYVYKKSSNIIASNHLPEGASLNSNDTYVDTNKKTEDVKKDSKTASASLFGGLYHTITKGDTLYALALKNKTTVSNICNLNSITSRTTLRLGRKIKIK